ncbi:hypothetical protein ABN763_02605 [Spongiivirga sp. MCCC 1A20706]|uniref:hypothetical protein n=1 Tax=Spongiivirga sp. MCCC 1A20706 TaxID=3160963 RepID=UPI0039776CDF
MKLIYFFKERSKRFKKYFLEFLMLFLAVFLGFFADNLRDAYVEKRIEKEYIKSLINDLETDKTNIQLIVELNESRIKRLDSLTSLCFDFNLENRNDSQLYEHYKILNVRPDTFMPNEQTLQQLKNASGLRLIESKAVVHKILEYEHRKKELSSQQAYYETYHKSTSDLGLRLFTQKPFKEMASYRKRTGQIWNAAIKYKLLQDAPLVLNEFANRLYSYQQIVEYYNIMLNDTQKAADRLILQLQNDYRLKTI